MIIWNGLFFNSPSTYLMESLYMINDFLIIFLFSILIIVFFSIVLMIIMVYFNSYFYENHNLELVWTVIPFVVLIFISVPSLSCLYYLDSCIFCGVTLKVIGHQWYWSYFYSNFSDYSFDSYIVNNSFIRLLEVDNVLLIPCSTPLRVLVRSEDVIHSWTVPSFGVKIDAVPGRINQLCFIVKKVGIFFGQCSEICGANHRFMPIVLESVPLINFISALK